MTAPCDKTILHVPNTGAAESLSIKQEELTEETPVTKKGKKTSHKLSRQDENKNIEQSEEKASEHIVKDEEEFFPVTEQESESLGTGNTPVTEGQKVQEEDDGESFKTLENGVIFFFYRPRVGCSGAHGIHDIARSFIVLRPAPLRTALDQKGLLGFGEKFRLLVVPKKFLPKSGGVKEMAFVEKAGVTLDELQETFMAGFDYETQTYGARTMPEAKLYAKGVYTIMSAQRGSYLAYILTHPKKLGPVQKDFGLYERGSWLVQSKNPNFPSPPSFSLPNDPEYPANFSEKFGHYRWVPLRPELIDYPNAQLLLIGRSHPEASFVVPGARYEGKEKPDKKLEEMARENDEREMQFRGIDPVYGDLGLEVYHYPKISTAWDHS